MFELESKWGPIVIYAETIEPEAIAQITKMGNSILGKDAHIRIMPDAHAGAGCTIGTTMHVHDKVCPNFVGVDIGCGVTYAVSDIDFRGKLDKLDKIIRENIPYGLTVRGDHKLAFERIRELRCWDKLSSQAQNRALSSTGTLGGGNHFIEAYANGAIAVHTGSRNIGLNVAKYYQDVAIRRQKERMSNLINEEIKKIPEKEREAWLEKKKAEIKIDTSMAYLDGSDLEDYFHDMDICQDFADHNRHMILSIIVKNMKGRIKHEINSIHNFIDIHERILRKGAINADGGRELVIPMNMRDGILLCIGKGNPEWNNSAPHGAGRLLSRSAAKNSITLSEYKKSMEGIFSTCIGRDTIDESPMAYKNAEEIQKIIVDTVDIIEVIKPIYNFKAGEEE